VAVASAGPYASLHLTPDRQPHQHPTTQLLGAGCPSCRPTNSVKALKASYARGMPHDNDYDIIHQLGSVFMQQKLLTTAQQLLRWLTMAKSKPELKTEISDSSKPSENLQVQHQHL